MNTEHVTVLEGEQVTRILRGTFENRDQPACDVASLARDLAAAFAPIMAIPVDSEMIPFARRIQKNVRNNLFKMADTHESRWVLNAGGRNHAAREKERGVEARDMAAYDRLVSSSGYSHFEDFVDAEIQEFFRLRDKFLEWLSDDELTARIFKRLTPATMKSLITVELPNIFRKYFPDVGIANSPDSACNKFISQVLREAKIYRGPEPIDMIVKQRQRARSSL